MLFSGIFNTVKLVTDTKVVATSQNTPQFYFRNQYLLVFQAYCKNPQVLNLFYCRVIHPQTSVNLKIQGDKTFLDFPLTYVTNGIVTPFIA